VVITGIRSYLNKKAASGKSSLFRDCGGIGYPDIDLL